MHSECFGMVIILLRPVTIYFSVTTQIYGHIGSCPGRDVMINNISHFFQIYKYNFLLLVCFTIKKGKQNKNKINKFKKFTSDGVVWQKPRSGCKIKEGFQEKSKNKTCSRPPVKILESFCTHHTKEFSHKESNNKLMWCLDHTKRVAHLCVLCNNVIGGAKAFLKSWTSLLTHFSFCTRHVDLKGKKREYWNSAFGANRNARHLDKNPAQPPSISLMPGNAVFANTDAVRLCFVCWQKHCPTASKRR